MNGSPLTRSWFEQWRGFEEFERGVQQCCPDDSTFRDQQFKFWREAWVAAQFVERAFKTRAQMRLRLTPESSPTGDFELDDGSSVHTYEIAEAMDSSSPPAWKRMRAAGGSVLHESEEASSGALARATIPQLISKKADKGYPEGTGLVIYVNLWDDFERQGLQGLVPETEYKFASIWILASGTARQIYPG